jgi:hypothetical protein
MVLISSIYKCFVFLVLIELVGCATKTPPPPVLNEEAKEENKPQVTPEFGPQSVQIPSFKDKTKSYGLEGEQGTHFYAVDLNQDGFTDLVVLPDHYSVPVFYLYHPEQEKFVRQPAGIFLPSEVRASFLSFYDFDRDGHLDLMSATLNQKTEINPRPLEIYSGDWNGQHLIFHKKVKRFEYTEDPVSTLTFLDFDLDGELDFFQGNWFDTRSSRNPRPMHDRFYLGNEGFNFEEKTELLNLETRYDDDYKVFLNSRPTFSSSLCDVDLNGYPDILTSSSEGEADKLWLNLWSEKYNRRIFDDYAKETGYDQDMTGRLVPRGGGHGLFSACSDYNNNGLIDILKSEFTHSYEAEQRDRSSILTGKSFDFPPQFIRTPYEFERLEERWTHAAKRGRFIDLNFDGLLDILVDNSSFPPYTRLMLFQQNPDHSFQDQAKSLGLNFMNPSGSIILDVNKDGRPDIISGQVSIRDVRIKRRVYVFENQIPYDGRRILRVFPKGVNSHPQAIGARVILRTNKRQQQRFLRTTLGATPSQHEAGVFFGIEKDESLKSLKVVWPYEKNGSPLTLSYDVSSLDFNKFMEIVVCEDGRLHKKRRSSCLPR